MRQPIRIAILAGVGAAIVATVVVRQRVGARPRESDGGSGLPRLVEIGGEQCVICRQMAPIIESLRRELAGRLKVESVLCRGRNILPRE